MANGTFGGGDGTEAYPYLVEDARDLFAVRDSLGSFYRQTKDIDLSEYPNWTPIGSSNGGFTGTYDGQGYSITNLKISSHPMYTGLFGSVRRALLIAINIVDCDISSGGTVGSLAGYSFGANIYNCHSSGYIECTTGNSVGGLLGYIESTGKISYSHSDCDVFSSGEYVGGFLGRIDQALSISDCYSTGNVRGKSNVGGFFGYARLNYDSGDCLISNCYSSGDVTGGSVTASFAGSVGHAGSRRLNIKNCFALSKKVTRTKDSSANTFFDFVANQFTGSYLENNYSLNSMQFVQEL